MPNVVTVTIVNAFFVVIMVENVTNLLLEGLLAEALFRNVTDVKRHSSRWGLANSVEIYVTSPKAIRREAILAKNTLD